MQILHTDMDRDISWDFDGSTDNRYDSSVAEIKPSGKSCSTWLLGMPPRDSLMTACRGWFAVQEGRFHVKLSSLIEGGACGLNMNSSQSCKG